MIPPTTPTNSYATVHCDICGIAGIRAFGILLVTNRLEGFTVLAKCRCLLADTREAKELRLLMLYDLPTWSLTMADVWRASQIPLDWFKPKSGGIKGSEGEIEQLVIHWQERIRFAEQFWGMPYTKVPISNKNQ